MTFKEIESQERKAYLVNYYKVWRTIEKYNRTQEVEKKIKDPHISTLICILNLYEDYINGNPKRIQI